MLRRDKKWCAWLSRRILAAAILLPAAAQAAESRPSSPFINHFRGHRAPEVAASDAEGNRVSIASLRGRVVIVNMWATWCPPCRAEMPSLERLAASYSQDVVVLAVSNDEQGWPVIREFFGNRFPHLHPLLVDRANVAEHLGILGLPFTIIIDRNGNEAGRLPRATEWDKGEAKLLIANLVAQRKRQ